MEYQKRQYVEKCIVYILSKSMGSKAVWVKKEKKK